jgi:hypothetical protein
MLNIPLRKIKYVLYEKERGRRGDQHEKYLEQRRLRYSQIRRPKFNREYKPRYPSGKVRR